MATISTHIYKTAMMALFLLASHNAQSTIHDAMMQQVAIIEHCLNAEKEKDTRGETANEGMQQCLAGQRGNPDAKIKSTSRLKRALLFNIAVTEKSIDLLEKLIESGDCDDEVELNEMEVSLKNYLHTLDVLNETLKFYQEVVG